MMGGLWFDHSKWGERAQEREEARVETGVEVVRVELGGALIILQFMVDSPWVLWYNAIVKLNALIVAALVVAHA